MDFMVQWAGEEGERWDGQQEFECQLWKDFWYIPGEKKETRQQTTSQLPLLLLLPEPPSSQGSGYSKLFFQEADQAENSGCSRLGILGAFVFFLVLLYIF